MGKAVWPVVAALAGLGMPELARPATERELLPLEEVIVTARRREESAQEIPIAVTAFDEDFLREQNITELQDLGIHIPSFRISSGGPGTNTPLVTLRGQRPSTVELTLDPAVPLYFAEVVLTPTQGTNLALYDLANVQVLKGPQGTLFGRNSTGGAVLVTPRTPGDEFGGYAEVRVGDYDLVHLEGAVDLPVSDSLKMRLAARSIDRDGYQSNVADNALRESDKYWDEDSYGIRLTTEFAPSTRLSNLTTIAYDENEMLPPVPEPKIFNSDAQLGQLVDPVHNGSLDGLFGTPVGTLLDDAVERQRNRDWDKIESDVVLTEKTENWFVANTTEFDLGDDLTIKNIFGYRKLDSSQNSDPDGTALPIFGAITSTTGRVTRNPGLGSVDADQYSDELQLLGQSLDTRLEWIVGAYWMKMDGFQSLPIQVVGANPDWPQGPSPLPVPELELLWAVAQEGFLQDSPRGDVDNEAYAIFGEGTYTLNDSWSITLGARQTWDKRELDAQNFSLDLDTLKYGCAMRGEDGELLPDDACSRKVDEDYDKLTWRGSVNYTPTEDMLLYGSVATGYRTGGFSARGVNDFTLRPFDEETVLTYEVGHKTDWKLGNLASMRTNLAIFFQEYDDIQKTVSRVSPANGAFETYTINAAEADIWGVEFDITVAPTANLFLTFAWSYVDTEYQEWDRFVPALDSVVDYTRASFEYIPEHSLTGAVHYTLPLDEDIGEVSVSANAYWQDEMQTNDDPWLWPELGWSEENLQEALAASEIDDYAVVNFRVDWRGVLGSRFDLAAYVNNATDEDYITGGLSVPKDLGVMAFNYGAPRTYGASLRYNF